MQQKEIEDFILEEKDNHIEVKPKFTIITSEMEKELIAILNTAYFAVKSDIRLDLSKMEYVTAKTRLVILDISKEMNKQSRKLAILGAPISLKNFIKRFNMKELIYTDR